MKSVFRIYTQDVNRDAIESILQQFTPGYTLYSGSGSFRGNSEDSLVIEIFGITAPQANDIANILCSLNKQQSVSIVELPAIVSHVSLPALSAAPEVTYAA